MSQPTHAAGRRFTLGRAVAVGGLASVVIVAVAFVMASDRSGTLAETAPRAQPQLRWETLPPPAPGWTPRPAPALDEAGRLAVPVAAPPLPPSAPPPAIAAAQVPSPVEAPAPVPPARVFGGAMVSPPDSEWAAIDGTLGCPSAAPGSVMEMLCALNAQSLTREYQLKLMEQDARRAEIASRRAQAEATRREAERRMAGARAELPSIEGRATAPAAPLPAGPTVVAIRGQGAQWTAILRLADGASATVRPGSDLPGGIRVLRIDRDGVVVRGTGGERRLAFMQSLEPEGLPRLGGDKGP